MSTNDILYIIFGGVIGIVAVAPWGFLFLMRHRLRRIETSNDILAEELVRERRRTADLSQRFIRADEQRIIAQSQLRQYNMPTPPPPPDIGANYAAKPAVRTSVPDSTAETTGAIAPAAPPSAQQTRSAPELAFVPASPERTGEADNS